MCNCGCNSGARSCASGCGCGCISMWNWFPTSGIFRGSQTGPCMPWPFMPPVPPVPPVPLPFQLAFIKADPLGHAVPNAQFALTDAVGTVIFTAVSDATGVVRFNPILPGTYILRETQAAPGFLLSTETFPVTVAADGTVTVNGMYPGNFNFPRNLPSARFEFGFLKTGTGGAPLAGATFGLRNPLGVDVLTAISNSDGIVTFTAIPPGTYALHEISAPAGYIPSTKTFTVVVDVDGVVHLYGLRPIGSGTGVGQLDSSVVNTPMV